MDHIRYITASKGKAYIVLLGYELEECLSGKNDPGLTVTASISSSESSGIQVPAEKPVSRNNSMDIKGTNGEAEAVASSESTLHDLSTETVFYDTSSEKVSSVHASSSEETTADIPSNTEPGENISAPLQDGTSTIISTEVIVGDIEVPFGPDQPASEPEVDIDEVYPDDIAELPNDQEISSDSEPSFPAVKTLWHLTFNEDPPLPGQSPGSYPFIII